MKTGIKSRTPKEKREELVDALLPGWMRSETFRTVDQVIGMTFISLIIFGLIMVALASGCAEAATESEMVRPGITVTLDDNGAAIDVQTIVGEPGEPFEVTIRNVSGHVIEQETFDGDFDDLLRSLPPGSLQAMERAKADWAKADSAGTEVRK